jgi:Adenylate and Guanylate cyclase catalytic domain/SAM domain (Sterile alpha motif)
MDRAEDRLSHPTIRAADRPYPRSMIAGTVACEGTVEKYVGDEIFAVFGMPTPSDRDAENALRCAEQMLKALDQWNDERQKLQEPPLRIGIGLNYGSVVVGDVGSAHSVSFTVIGDTVEEYPRPLPLIRTEDHRMDVAAWLCGLGLDQYAELFRDNDIDGEILCGMTAEDPKELASTPSATAVNSSTLSLPWRRSPRPWLGHWRARHLLPPPV